MAKTKSVYVCQNCGAESPKWIGKCPSCGEWNSYVEEVIRKEIPSKAGYHTDESSKSKPVRIEEVESISEQRIDTYSAEFNRVLGGGLVSGSLVLLGGEPGIGKSTLILQVALNMIDKKVLYVSGEESVKQLKLRSERLREPASECFVVSETSLEQIFVHIRNVQPDVVVIDSIQTISTEYAESSPGSVTQVRECSAALLKFAKETGIPVLLIGHINKEGSIAGPKVLEHIVDTVLQFEGDQNYMRAPNAICLSVNGVVLIINKREVNFNYFNAATFSTIFKITSTAFSIEGTGMYSKRPWKLCPPAKIFGQGNPLNDN